MFNSTRVLIIGIVCVLFLFFVAAISIEIHAQRKQATELAQDVAESLSVMLKNDLEEWLPLHKFLDTIDDKRRYLHLDELVRHNLLNAELEKVKFYNSRGILIYAEKLELLGQDHADKEELQQALHGQTCSVIIDTKEYENAYGQVHKTSLIETYLPVYDNQGKVSHVMEVYQDFDPIKERIETNLLRSSAMIVGVALLTFAVINVLLRKLSVIERERDLLISFLPICSFCKKIREEPSDAAEGNEKPKWVQLEQYLTDHENLEFSHGLCDECMQENYGELLKK
jgi:hypothetical protein